MKKILLTIAFVSALTTMSAQTESEKSTEADSGNGYNRWSLELNGGVNRPSRNFTFGYATATPSPYNLDFGARYMFNNKFGLKADIGYYSFENKNGYAEFNSNYSRIGLQGVINFGRVLNFESFTKSFGLLMHIGGSYAQLKAEDKPFTDRMGNFIVGITAQVKLSDRIAFNADLTSMTNLSQNYSFDGNTNLGQRQGFDGGIFSGTVGFTVYLGKNQVHADWYVEGDKMNEELEGLKKKVADIETMMNDTDKDGVADYLDAEPNSTGGVLVDAKGRAVDTNANGVPDSLESYMSKTYGDNANKTTIARTDNELVRALINEGYVTAYFDYNKSTPTNVSSEGIDFILTYLRNNPSANIDIIGHADELGRTEYNNKLSTARANAVKDVLVKAKIDASRLNVVAGGEDASVDKNSDGARKLVRRVTFKVK